MRFSHPDWVVDGLAGALGRPDELEALLAADNQRPRVTLVARPGLSTVAELASAFTEPAESTVSPLGVTRVGGPRDDSRGPGGPGGGAGRGLQLVALALSRAPLDGGDERWLDLCAGPGGKAALLGALATDRGARLLANERQLHRARLVAGRCGRPGRRSRGDGTRPPWAEGTFDRVLVDAPCSGLGALRRRPESRWRRRPEDLGVLVPLQRACSQRAGLGSAGRGGALRHVLACRGRDGRRGRGRPGRRPTSGWRTRGRWCLRRPMRRRSTSRGAVQLWPHRHGTDAMFMALLRRLNPAQP